MITVGLGESISSFPRASSRHYRLDPHSLETSSRTDSRQQTVATPIIGSLLAASTQSRLHRIALRPISRLTSLQSRIHCNARKCDTRLWIGKGKLRVASPVERLITTYKNNALTRTPLARPPPIYDEVHLANMRENGSMGLYEISMQLCISSPSFKS